MKRIEHWTCWLAPLLAMAACGHARPSLPAPSRPFSASPNAAFREKAPAPIEGLQVWAPPQVASRTLSNGMHVLVVERHDYPIASVRYANRAAANHVKSDPAGLAMLVGDALLAGTVTSPTEVMVGQRVAGVRPHVLTSDFGTTVELDVLSSAVGPAVETIAQIVRRPELSREGVRAATRQQDAWLFADNQHVDSLVMSLELEVLFGSDHPFVVGDRAIQRQLAKLTEADVKRYYDKTYGPTVSALIVVGDVSAEGVFDLAERSFGDWKHQVAPSKAPAPTMQPQRTMVRAVAAGGDLTRLIMVQPAVSATDPQAHAFQLLARIIGGGDSFGANSVLRHERGVTYGVSASLVSLSATGFLLLRSSVENNALYHAVETLREQLRRLRRAPIGDAELSVAKRAYLSAFRFTSTEWLAHALALLDMQGLSSEWLVQARATVEAITPAGLCQLARQYLDPDHAEIIAVGDLRTSWQDIKRLGKPVLYEIKRDR